MRGSRRRALLPSHLPDELIELIVRILVPSLANYKQADTQTLASLSLVCRQWHRIVEPYLYCHIHTHQRGSEANFAETLTNEPDFARYIKTLIGSRTLLTDCLTPVRIPFEQTRKELLEDKRRKYFNHQYRALVPTLQNLQVLDVSEASYELSYQDTGQTPPWLGLMYWHTVSSEYHPHLPLPQNARPGQGFQNLKRLDAVIHDLPVGELYHAFRLPAIETLNFKGGDMRNIIVNHNTAQRYVKGWNFKSSTIKHLSFDGAIPCEGIMGIGGLFFIAQALACLQSLTFVGSKDRGFGANMYRMLIADFQDCITSAQFRRLEMWDRRTTRDDKRTAVKFDGAARFFATFSPVEEMVLDSGILESLWDRQMATMLLPSKLQTLHIRSSCKWTAELCTPCVLLLADMSANLTMCPSLKEVSVELQVGDRLGEKTLKAIYKRFTDRGIRFTMSKKEDCAWGIDRFVDTLTLLARRRHWW